MKIPKALMNARLDEHFEYERQDDIAGVLASLAPDAEHDVVGWPAGPSQGRDAARDFYVQMFADLAGREVTTVRRLYGDRFVVDESLWRGTARGRPFGLPGGGRPLAFRLLHVLEFDDTAQISREQVWVDLASIQQQLSGE